MESPLKRMKSITSSQYDLQSQKEVNEDEIPEVFALEIYGVMNSNLYALISGLFTMSLFNVTEVLATSEFGILVNIQMKTRLKQEYALKISQRHGLGVTEMGISDLASRRGFGPRVDLAILYKDSMEIPTDLRRSNFADVKEMHQKWITSNELHGRVGNTLIMIMEKIGKKTFASEFDRIWERLVNPKEFLRTCNHLLKLGIEMIEDDLQKKKGIQDYYALVDSNLYLEIGGTLLNDTRNYCSQNRDAIMELRSFWDSIFYVLQALQKANIDHGNLHGGNLVMSLDQTEWMILDYDQARHGQEGIMDMTPSFYFTWLLNLMNPPMPCKIVNEIFGFFVPRKMNETQTGWEWPKF